MSKRAYCEACRSAKRLCFCDALTPQTHQHKITILQHPSESKHAKGSAWICQRVLEHCQLIIGETTADFADLRSQVLSSPQHWALLYPSENSSALTPKITGEAGDNPQTTHWIILDATWRKAYKMLKLNPWLNELSHYHLNHSQASAYTIRKAPSPDYLSTLEAVALLLASIEDFDPAPLQKLLARRISQQQQHMSVETLKRYKSTD